MGNLRPQGCIRARFASLDSHDLLPVTPLLGGCPGFALLFSSHGRSLESIFKGVESHEVKQAAMFILYPFLLGHSRLGDSAPPLEQIWNGGCGYAIEIHQVMDRIFFLKKFNLNAYSSHMIVGSVFSPSQQSFECISKLCYVSVEVGVWFANQKIMLPSLSTKPSMCVV